SRDERHQDYTKVVENASLYRKLLTGENMDTLMHQFNMRESKELFDQRVAITQHITKTVSQNVKDVYHKIPRSNSVQRFVGYEDNDIERQKKLNDKLRTFWGKSSLDDFMNTRWIDLNFLDPNAFIVLEWGLFDNRTELAKPYPYEVYSENAIMYEYKENVLQYLVSLNKKSKWVLTRDGVWESKVYDVFTMYGINETIQFVQIIDDAEAKEAKKAYSRNNKDLVIDLYFRPSIYSETFYRIVLITPHNLGFVPADRVGVISDMSTDGRTFISPMDKGVPILMKMVKANSEFDLTMALHTFPQKIQYMGRCSQSDCRNGHLIGDDSPCPKCHGTGFDIITSAQEAITLAMPKDPNDMFDLAQMIHYHYPPAELVKFQKDYIDALTYQVKESIFNTEIFSRQQVAETATGKNISLQNVYDALYPIAIGYSTDWEFFVHSIAKIIELDKGLIAFYKFSKDFKLKSLTDLYLDLKAVGDAKASEFIKSSIEDDIAGVIYSESERDLLKYNVKKSWFPFNGKSPEQIAQIIATNLVPKETKVFWANFSYIFDLIELEQSKLKLDFFNAPRDKQWEIIQAKIKEIDGNLEVIEEPTLPDETME
ncbi:MAG: hypothetical protein WCY09_09515, partial [Candidatus Omnitrophota bacterium]